MALDGFYLNTITKELRNKLEGSRCDKISQPEKDEIILSFKNRNGSFKVLLTSATDSARVHFTDISKQNPMQAPLFTMVLRKYLQGGKLKDIHQFKGDRILIFEFEASDELGFSSVYKLICEMMGKHSNIILVRERDNKIVECIKHVSHDMNKYRLLLPGAEYIYPPDQNKLNPADYTDDELIPWLTEDLDKQFFMRRFTGISKKTSERLFDIVNEKCHIMNDPEALTLCIRKILTDALDADTFYCFLDEEIPVDISLIPPTESELYEIKEFTSPSECLEFYISSKDLASRVKERSSDILRVVSGNIERVEKKLSILNAVLEEAGEKDKLLIQGELLKANLYTLPEGKSSARVLNYYSEKEDYMDIDLDPNKTVSENMQIYFKKYNKLKRSEE
ncbi:MAG: NFACT family protein, partial [Clostridiaceae bacterium]